MTAVAAGGHRLRRRRQATQVLGSGLAIAAVLAVGIPTLSALDGGEGHNTVTAAGDPMTKPQPGVNGAPAAAEAQANEKANLGVLLKALGPDWRASDDQVGGAVVDRGRAAPPPTRCPTATPHVPR
ncbi:hypothetical protein [Sporichthya polymorpha]|uniref:hypothetical protein n=1 Tax=Sporichthya polymorpha TaxID=35751 RepID=UPI0012EB90FC|nr:hypothetical protein [Sporichthya polymorpha]